MSVFYHFAAATGNKKTVRQLADGFPFI